MFLAIFPYFGSAQYVIFLYESWEFQFSNIQYFVVFDSIRKEKRSQNELVRQNLGDI